MSDFVEEHASQVRQAAERVKPHIRRTPTLGADLDPDIRLKAECFQVTGSFKARGAFNAVLSLIDRGPRIMIRTVSWLTMIPRASIISCTSRKLSGKRW